MFGLHLAELRDSWTAWLGVCIGFLVINFTLALSALALLSGIAAVNSGKLALDESAAFVWAPGMNLVFCAVIGATVIGSSTSLVVDSRRGSLARLALNGATPAQVVRTVLSQLVVVSVTCSVLGGGLALLVVEPALFFLAYGRRDDEGLPPPDSAHALWPVLLAGLFAVVLTLLGGLKQARLASRIPPVEALRLANDRPDDRITVLRWIRVGVWLLIVIAAFGAIPAITAEPTKETMSNLLQVSLVLLIVVAALLADIAPLLVGPLTRAWTKLVPSIDPSWDLARATTIAKASRLTKSIIPVMVAIGLIFGMVAQGDVLVSSLAASGFNIPLTGVGIGTFVIFLGLPLLIALSGGVGSLIMMSKQRDAELALSGIIGTTPAQRIAMPIMEGLIIAVTGAILSLVMVVVAIGYLAVGFSATEFTFAFSPSYLTFAAAFGITLLITVLATLVPTLPSSRTPEPRIIARLTAQ